MPSDITLTPEEFATLFSVEKRYDLQYSACAGLIVTQQGEKNEEDVSDDVPF